MNLHQTYEVLLQEVRTCAIQVTAADADEAEQLATDLYLHAGFDTERCFRHIERGGYDVLDVSLVHPQESTDHAAK